MESKLEVLGKKGVFVEGPEGTFATDGKLLAYSREVTKEKRRIEGKRQHFADAMEKVIERHEGRESGMVEIGELAIMLKALRHKTGENTPLLYVRKEGVLLLSGWTGGNEEEQGLMSAYVESDKSSGEAEVLLDARYVKKFEPEDGVLFCGDGFVTYVTKYKGHEYKAILRGLDLKRAEKEKEAIVRELKEYERRWVI